MLRERKTMRRRWVDRGFAVGLMVFLPVMTGCERQAPQGSSSGSPKSTAPEQIAGSSKLEDAPPKAGQPAKSDTPRPSATPLKTETAPSKSETPKTEMPPSTANSTPVRPAPLIRIPGGGKLKNDNVLLVTYDTTRADRFGCYGHSGGLTPRTDGLAARGTLFEDAYCQVPLTLPSHASIFTGRFPREHGLHANGRHRLADSIPTLATVFKQLGHKTGAFVASFVLDSRFGLDRDFDEYNDDMGPVEKDQSPFEREQPGNVVTDRALAWLETAKDEPFFAWVHYFDPHHPYQPPAEFHVNAAGPYGGEIAFMDAQMGRLLDFLDKEGLTSRTLVVVVGDHGESFGENGEQGHSKFVHRAVTHVPFVMAHPTVTTAGRRVPATVQLVDLYPTLLSLFGVQAPGDLGGRSLVDALAGKDIPSTPAFIESLTCRQVYNWAEQRAIITKDWRYISSAKPQLFDRKNDTLEVTNVADAQPERASELRDALETHFKSLVAVEGGKARLTPEDVRKLAAIGYAGGSDLGAADFLTPDLAEPRDLMDVANKIALGQQLIQSDDAPAAIPLLESAFARAPGSLMLLSSLGHCYVTAAARQKDLTGKTDPKWVERAVELLKAALEIDPANEGNLVSMGSALALQGNLEGAIKHYEIVAKPDTPFPDVFAKLGHVQAESGRRDEAMASLRKALELDPNSTVAHFEMGFLLTELRRTDEALVYYLKAYEYGDRQPQLLYNIGVASLHAGKLEQAVDYFEQALTRRPEYPDAMLNLGIAFYRLKRTGEGNAMMMKVSKYPDKKLDATYNLALGLIEGGQRHEGIGFLENIVKQLPTYSPAVNALLAQYLDTGRSRDATRVLEHACKNFPTDPRYPTTMSRLLATSRDDEVRNGADALSYAGRASDMTGHSHPEVLQWLAAAYAETGDFDNAVKTAEKALGLTSQSTNAELRAALERQLQNYREKKPYRDPKL